MQIGSMLTVASWGIHAHCQQEPQVRAFLNPSLHSCSIDGDPDRLDAISVGSARHELCPIEAKGQENITSTNIRSHGQASNDHLPKREEIAGKNIAGPCSARHVPEQVVPARAPSQNVGRVGREGGLELTAIHRAERRPTIEHEVQGRIGHHHPFNAISI